MRREPRAYLWDAHRAAVAIREFSHGKDRDDFAQDLLLRGDSSRSSAKP